MPKMTVADLISALEDLDPKAEVMLTSDYGDYCHTEQALEIEEVEEVTLEESGYSASGWAVKTRDEAEQDEDLEEEGDDPIPEEPTRKIVAIRSHVPSRR